MNHRLIILALFLFISSVAQAEAIIYKWVDENGAVSFRDTPPPNGMTGEVVNVDPEGLGAVSGLPEPEVKTQEEPNRIEAPSRLKKNTRTPPQFNNADVELFVTSWCPYCHKAIAFFRERGIPFRSYDIEEDKAAAKRKSQLDSRRGIPFAVINGTKVHGYNEQAYLNALENRK